MACDLGPADGDDEDQVVSTINTTPLVDVMLVLLIIFLITIPVVTHTVPVKLPSETNVARPARWPISTPCRSAAKPRTDSIATLLRRTSQL